MPCMDPVVSSTRAAPGPPAEGVGPIVWMAGTSWDGVPGTDKRLVMELARLRRVVWVDPPRRVSPRDLRQRPAPEEVHPGVTRVQVLAPPAATRALVRGWTSRLLQRAVAAAMAGPEPASAVVVAHPYARFPRGGGVTRVLYSTDDWIAGAPLMGFSPRHLRAVLTANVREADLVLGVSPPILESLQRLAPARASVVLPNGAPDLSTARLDGAARAGAILVGQLNARLDARLLRLVADAGVDLTVVGPVVGDEACRAQFDQLFAHPRVTGLGLVSPAEVAQRLSRAAVGLTPYRDDGFNRASFPLKTLEYLAAGLPVVSTDLPASRWLNTSHVAVATSDDDFVRLARQASEGDGGGEQERVALAHSHSWGRRAERLLELVDGVASTAASSGTR